MRELSSHLRDIAENSFSAGASWVGVSVYEDCKHNNKTLERTNNDPALKGVSINEPTISHYLRQMIEEGIEKVRQTKTTKEKVMPLIKSLDDLKRIREEALKIKALKNNEGKTEVIISMGTAGIAAGARESLKAIISLIEAKQLPNIIIRQTDNLGFEGQDPVVQIQVPGGEKITYIKVDPAVAERIVEAHICNGAPLEEHQLKS
ncbi:MAG: (2Fe-2S) ferredoxin domain-containing protein [Anaerolineaceae bacterium]